MQESKTNDNITLMDEERADIITQSIASVLWDKYKGKKVTINKDVFEMVNNAIEMTLDTITEKVDSEPEGLCICFDDEGEEEDAQAQEDAIRTLAQILLL